MKRIAYALSLVLLLVGCGKTLPQTQEQWTVLERTYVGTQHGSGFSSKGSYVSSTTPEQWNIVFQTPEGVRTVDDRAWWAIAPAGKTFTVTLNNNSIWGSRPVEYR